MNFLVLHGINMKQHKPISLDPPGTLSYILIILFEYCSGGIKNALDGYDKGKG
jgi:hypothetical protein